MNALRMISLFCLMMLILPGCSKKETTNSNTSPKTTSADVKQVSNINIEPFGGILWTDNISDVIIKLNQLGVKEIYFFSKDKSLVGLNDPKAISNSLGKIIGDLFESFGTSKIKVNDSTETVAINDSQAYSVLNTTNVITLKFGPIQVEGVAYNGQATFCLADKQSLGFLSKNPNEIMRVHVGHQNKLLLHRLIQVILEPTAALSNSDFEKIKAKLESKYGSFKLSKNPDTNSSYFGITDSSGNYINMLPDEKGVVGYNLSNSVSEAEAKLGESILHPEKSVDPKDAVKLDNKL